MWHRPRPRCRWHPAHRRRGGARTAPSSAWADPRIGIKAATDDEHRRLAARSGHRRTVTEIDPEVGHGVRAEQHFVGSLDAAPLQEHRSQTAGTGLESHRVHLGEPPVARRHVEFADARHGGSCDPRVVGDFVDDGRTQRSLSGLGHAISESDLKVPGRSVPCAGRQQTVEALHDHQRSHQGGDTDHRGGQGCQRRGPVGRRTPLQREARSHRRHGRQAQPFGGLGGGRQGSLVAVGPCSATPAGRDAHPDAARDDQREQTSDRHGAGRRMEPDAGVGAAHAAEREERGQRRRDPDGQDRAEHRTQRGDERPGHGPLTRCIPSAVSVSPSPLVRPRRRLMASEHTTSPVAPTASAAINRTSCCRSPARSGPSRKLRVLVTSPSSIRDA